MPEGDTIAKAAARLRPLLVGAELVEARHRGHALRDLVGVRVQSIDTHGKHLWIRFADGTAAHVHLGMEGKWTLLSPDGLRERRWQVDSASLALVVARGGALCLHAPTVELLRGPDARRGIAALGPDILAADFDPTAVLERAHADPERPLGEVLLDQRVVAGIGNVWKSELCFLEKLDPRAPMARIADEALIALLRRGATMMGQNLTPRLRQTTQNPRQRYWVYRLDGRPCARCRTPIQKIQQGDEAGRSTYFCPSCQNG